MQTNTNSAVLGRSVVLHGELTANEDLLIEGQFDGSLNLQDHCLTVGASGQIKAEIHARQVVVHGKVTGNIASRDKVEIRKTGHVLGDLTTSGIVIEDGAYFKGSIEILRDENLLDAAEELEAIRAFDAAKTSKESPVPFDQAVREIERSRR